MEITTPQMVNEVKSTIYGALKHKIEEELKKNYHEYDGTTLNILIDDVDQKSITEDNISKIKKEYLDAGWDSVELYPVEEFSRIRIKLSKY